MTERIYPFLHGRMKGIHFKENAFDSYFQEPLILGEKGLHSLLDQGKRFAPQLTQTLCAGGSAIFPHTYLSECGYQIAAVVQACLDSGSDQVIALGTMHPMNEALLQARTKELNGQVINDEPSWGLLGPTTARDDCWKLEFSLSHFKTLWEAEVKRRGSKAPELIELYPHLVNSHPETLPGIQELKARLKDAVIVATDDMCHHGLGYGVDPKQAIELSEEAYAFAKQKIVAGFLHLQDGKYSAYYEHWMDPLAIGDPSDCAIVLGYLLGPCAYEVLDLKLVDLTRLFAGNTSPSWVAATLVEITP